MSRNYWLITLILIGGSISLFATIFLLPKNSPPKSSATTQNAPVNSTPAEVLLPINIDASSVFAASVVYTFDGNIQSINTIPTGLELITNISVPSLPAFIVCITCNQQTQVYGMFKKNMLRVNYAELSPNQHVRIVASYNLKTKEWTIPRVNIMEQLTLPTSPPRNPSNTPAATSSAR